MIRLHIPGVPYTITNNIYSHDAYTGKVLRFSPMMRSVGFEVYHYGIEGSESGATKHIDLMTKEEWIDLRIKTWQFVDKSLSYEEAKEKNEDHTQVISKLSNWSSPLTKEFNARFRKHLMKNYRSNKTDIVCIPLNKTYKEALDNLDYIIIESGIGYEGSSLNYRIFESYAWLSSTLGKENKTPSNYWFVVPNYFDISEFKLSLTPLKNRIGFLGRINDLKGCRIIMEIARKFPDVEFILCGQGDPKPYLEVPNVKYKEPIHGSERSEYLGSCMAVLCLSKYLEPFCGVAVEAQLCGTPVISTDWGAMVETVEYGKTGLRGHTLGDFCYGVQMALDSKFDRQYIRDRAVRLYGMYNVAKQYDYTFRSILDIHTPGKNGWYSPDAHIKRLYEEPVDKIKQKRIYIFIPYYGAFPNYFQLYLDSLGINTDILTVFLITDIDMAGYVCPKNLVVIKMPKSDIKKRASKFILDTYEKVVEPENLIKDNYKFVDFKIVLPLLFDDLLKEHSVTEGDFVGWGDIDLIYGKLSNFIDLNKGYGILGGWHGHFAAIQNTDSFKNNFKTIPNYLELITDNSKTFITDEIAYRKPLEAYLSKHNIKMCYTNAHFCDIVPPCFFHMSRPDHKEFEKNFYDLYNSRKNINYLYYNKADQKLTVLYDTGDKREVLYCHLQKRKMELPFTSYEKGYYINESSFSIINEVIPRKIWQTWNTHELPPRMKEYMDILKNDHPGFEYRLFDEEQRRNFIKDNFPEEVVLAYDALIPGAYKADLWRYCILYIHGGIYLDARTKLVDGFTLDSLLDKEYRVRDGKFKKNNIEYASICNGMMICKKGNPLLLNAIVNIVYNVSTKFMGMNPWQPTGPFLLGNNLDIEYNNIDFTFGSFNGTGTIRNMTGKVISVNYPEYRTEQRSTSKQEYYIDLWNKKSIYNDCSIDLLKVYNEKRWPKEFHNSLKYILNKMEPSSYSQLGQDLDVINYYKKKPDGYFIEIGAYDGIMLSNTYLLEKKYNWKGICVDALPSVFDTLKNNRPNSICSNSLIYSNSKVNKQFDICNKDKAFSGISDLLITHRGFVDKSKETISIETVSLMDILDRYNAPSFIEYLSLGIEGGELEALKTFDFNKYAFGLINIKHNYLEPLRSNIRNLLKSNSYVHVKENKWVDYYKHSSVSEFIHRNNVCPLLYKTINTMKSKKGSIILNHRLDNRPIYTNNTFNVFISSEPEEPTRSNYDMIILPFVSSLPKTIYYPFLYMALAEMRCKEFVSVPKNKYCAFMYFKSYKHRNDIFEKLCVFKNIDALGKACNNTKLEDTRYLYSEDKTFYDLAVEIYSEYYFVLSIENSWKEGYFTEKILNPILAHSIPIYWGHPKVFEYINKKRVIYLPDYNDYSELFTYLDYLMNNNDAYNAILNEPTYTEKGNPPRVEDEFKSNLIQAGLEKSSSQMYIPVIYYHNKSRVFCEQQWLEYIIGKKFVFYKNTDIMNFDKDTSVILIYQGCVNVKLIEQWLDCNIHLKPFLFHISDEFCTSDISIYNHKSIIKVFRNYWRPDAINPKVIHLPLGYYKCNTKEVKPLSERLYTWSFAGAMDRPHRKEILSTLETLQLKSKIHKTPTFGSSVNLSEEEYLQLLLDTKLVPCLPGYANVECFRFYESLECGAIPIISTDDKQSYLNILNKSCPVELIGFSKTSWANINDIANNPDKMASNNILLQKWWKDYKDYLKSMIQDIIYR